jgi:hypothetical protein
LQVIPNQQSVNPNASLAFAVPTTIPVGHSIVVAIACSTAGDPLTTNHTVTDSAGNTYTTHVVVEAGNYGTVYISSAPVTTQLTGGASTVTAHYPTFSGPSSGAVFDFCGTLASLATNSSTGNSTTPSSGFVAAAVGNLVLGGFGYGDNGAAYGGLNAGLANVEGGSTISGRRFQPMWQLISVAGNYAASGTLASGNFWAAAVVNFSVV